MIAITTPASQKTLRISLLPTRVAQAELAHAACLCALGDPSEESCRIFASAVQQAGRLYLPAGARLLTPTDREPLAGVDLKTRRIRMGRPRLVAAWVEERGGTLGAETTRRLAAEGAEALEPVLVADEKGDLGIIQLFGQLSLGLARAPFLPGLELREPALAGAFSRLPGLA